MSKIPGPLFMADKHKKDETTVTASNPRDSTVTFDGKLPWEIFDFPSEEKYSTAVDNDDAENIKPQDSDGFDAYFDEGDDDAVFAEAYPDIPDNDESDAFNFEECDADSIEPDHDDFWDSPFNVQVKPINDSGSTTDTHNEFETLKTHKPSIKETYKDAVYTDHSGKEKIDRITFVDIYINDNSLIIAQDTTSNNDAQLIHIYANGKYTHYSDIDVKRDITRIINELNKQLLSVSEVNDILARIKLQAPRIDIDDFDSDENIINFKNGLVDIRTGTLLPHSSNVFSTIQIPCNYSPATFEELKKYAPVFFSFLKTITNHKKNVATLLLKYLAFIISNIKGSRLKKAMILFGPGNTGKSKLIELVQFLLGAENYAVCDIAALEKRFIPSLLYHKRLAGSSDMPFTMISELNVFKTATGGDQIFAEKKGKDGFHFKYNGMFLFATNRLPKFYGDKGDWVYDRFIIIKCENVIPKEQQDHRLIDKMKAEKDVIASYLVSLLPGIIKNDYQFPIPDECNLSLAEFRIENSPVLQFYTQFCRKREPKETPADKISGMMLFIAFKEWAKATHSLADTNYRDFIDEIASHLHIPRKDFFIRTNNTRYLMITVKKEYINDNGEIHLHY